MKIPWFSLRRSRLVVHDAEARSGGALLVRAFDGVGRRGDLADLRSDGGLTLPDHGETLEK